MSVKTYIVTLKKFKILPTIITHTILHYHYNSNAYLFRMSLSRSLSQRSQFFSVRTSNRVQQPTLTQVQCHCHRISLLELESFLSTYIFSYSARHDIQLAAATQMATNGQSTHIYIYGHHNKYCIVKDHLNHLAIFIKAN
jgi:hypothetical protein